MMCSDICVIVIIEQTNSIITARCNQGAGFPLSSGEGEGGEVSLSNDHLSPFTSHV